MTVATWVDTRGFVQWVEMWAFQWAAMSDFVSAKLMADKSVVRKAGKRVAGPTAAMSVAQTAVMLVEMLDERRVAMLVVALVDFSAC